MTKGDNVPKPANSNGTRTLNFMNSLEKSRSLRTIKKQAIVAPTWLSLLPDNALNNDRNENVFVSACRALACVMGQNGTCNAKL